MHSMIDPADRAWLAASGLVDPAVDLARVRLSTTGPAAAWVWLQRRSAMTIGHRIWFAKPERLRDRALLVHELVHVGQYHQRGVVRFFAAYLRDLAAAGFRYSARLPLEAPAYARQREAKVRLAAEQDTPPP